MSVELPAITGEDRAQIRDWAHREIGAGYEWLGEGPTYDCSGLTKMAWAPHGIVLPHQAAAQASRIRGNWTDPWTGQHYLRIGHVHPWSAETRDGLRLGDLVFLGGDVDDDVDGIYHVALFTGFAHKRRQITAAVSPQYGVIETDILWGGVPSGVGYIGH